MSFTKEGDEQQVNHIVFAHNDVPYTLAHGLSNSLYGQDIDQERFR
jgi:hypothetical protein